MCAFAFQANLNQGIRVVNRGIRIGDDTVQSDLFIHVAFPAFILRLLIYFDLLAATKYH